MRRQDPPDYLDLMVDDITLALRPYGIDPTDAAACAATLRAIANALSPTGPAFTAPPGPWQARSGALLNRAGGREGSGPRG